MDVLVSEVGPRDGLQSIKRSMPTQAKHKWIRALAAAGIREIEVASFVPPKLLPQMADAAEVAVGLSDTVGYANPAQVKRMFTRLNRELGDKAGGAHLHNTRGQGLANVVAALDAGVTTFDASQGGIGGCPHAPGASGNIVTEDLVYLLESMGLDTGIDLDKLIAARQSFIEGLPGEAIYGHVPDAGAAKNFKRAATLPTALSQGRG